MASNSPGAGAFTGIWASPVAIAMFEGWRLACSAFDHIAADAMAFATKQGYRLLTHVNPHVVNARASALSLLLGLGDQHIAL